MSDRDMVRLPADRSGSGAALKDKVRQSHAVIGVPHHVQAGRCLHHRFQLGHPVQMTNGILRHGKRPAPHHRFHGLRQRTQNPGQLRSGALDELLVRFVEQRVARCGRRKSREARPPLAERGRKTFAPQMCRRAADAPPFLPPGPQSQSHVECAGAPPARERRPAPPRWPTSPAMAADQPCAHPYRQAGFSKAPVTFGGVASTTASNCSDPAAVVIRQPPCAASIRNTG